ncbi:16618_t:CDS:2, partial [Acaulospora colombiana]
IDELQAENTRLQQTLLDERIAHDTASEAWHVERDELLSKLVDAQVGNVSNGTPKHDSNSQLKILQEELEAQWERTEKAEETIKSLHQENNTLKGTLRSLQEKLGDDDVNNFLELEQAHQELVNQLNDILASQQALEEERDQISTELRVSRQHVEDLMQSHSDLQRKLEQTEQEHGFATENIERLRQTLMTRDQEADRFEADRQQDLAQAEALRTKLSSAEKEYSRQISDCKRHIEELETQLRINAEQSTNILHETAEQTVYMATLEEKAKSRFEENERLRRRVHDLEQESAAKEVKLVETQKESDRIKEDNINLNIALDAKQQELELMKRREGTRGTAGTTPAPSRDKKQPRESSIFGVTPRPLSNYNKNFAETPATVTKQMHTNSILSSSAVKIPRDLKFGPPSMVAGPRPSITSPSPIMFPGPVSASSIRVNAGSRRSQTTLATSTRGLPRMGDHSDHTDNDDDEKENWLPSRSNRRSNAMVPS